MTPTQAMIAAGLKALRAWLPNEFEEDPRMITAIYEAMSAARNHKSDFIAEQFVRSNWASMWTSAVGNGDYSAIELNYPEDNHGTG